MEFVDLDEKTKRLLASVFTDEHYGRAISEEEYQDDLAWRAENAELINKAREMISLDPNFTSLDEEAKIMHVYNLMRNLKQDESPSR